MDMSADINNYYKQINNFIDEYLKDWKVNPKQLKKYLLNNETRLENFLKRKGLNEIDNIKK